MRLVLYKEQVGGMLVGVTPRPFWYVSWGEPVVVLFRVPVSSSSGRGGGGPGCGCPPFFFVPHSPRDKFEPWVPVIFFFVCKPVVVGGRGPAEEKLK